MRRGETRERIVGAAMELFWEKGYGSTSIADILSRAQVNSGSLYHYFPGKQDLLLAVLETYRDGIWPMLLEPACGAIADPVERVFALLAKYRELIVQTDCTYGCPIGSLALEIHEPDPAVRERMAENFAAWTAAVRGWLEEAAVDDAEAVAQFVLTVMEGAVMQARTYRDVGYFDRAVAQLRRHIDSLVMEKA